MGTVRSVRKRAIHGERDHPDIDISVLLARVEAVITEAFEAGQRSAISRLSLAVEGGSLIPFKAAAPKGRAPRGTSKQLIKRALSQGPLTVTEIASLAKTPEERSLSFSAVYLELVRGERTKRYRKVGGKWALPSGSR